MDNPNNNPTIGPEYTVEPITVKDMVVRAQLVMDRVTGEMYNPQERFDELMQKEEILAVFKRMKVR